VDLRTPAGAQIPVEERDASEVTHIAGKRVAAEGIRVFAPAFDVTPAELITAIVTDLGVARPPFGESLVALLGGPSGGVGRAR
jgi:methylthioribose-1-phosphate isomerase